MDSVSRVTPVKINGYAIEAQILTVSKDAKFFTAQKKGLGIILHPNNWRACVCNELSIWEMATIISIVRK